MCRSCACIVTEVVVNASHHKQTAIEAGFFVAKIWFT